MQETPGARQPWPDAVPPWDAWERPPPGSPPAAGPLPPGSPKSGHTPSAERRPPADHRLAPRRPGGRSRWHWLLLPAVVIPLLTPLYNRVQPQLLGLPFFYWAQIAFTGLAALVTAVIHVATKKRRP